MKNLYLAPQTALQHMASMQIMQVSLTVDPSSPIPGSGEGE